VLQSIEYVQGRPGVQKVGANKEIGNLRRVVTECTLHKDRLGSCQWRIQGGANLAMAHPSKLAMEFGPPPGQKEQWKYCDFVEK